MDSAARTRTLRQSSSSSFAWRFQMLTPRGFREILRDAEADKSLETPSCGESDSIDASSPRQLCDLCATGARHVPCSARH